MFLQLCWEYIFPFATSKLEDTKQEGQEQETKDEKPQQQIPGEENGIEMSENFEGAMHDVETGEEEENDKSEEENEDESDVDKQMGEVDGKDTEKLDEKMWGDSDDEDEKEVDWRNIVLRTTTKFLYFVIKLQKIISKGMTGQGLKIINIRKKALKVEALWSFFSGRDVLLHKSKVWSCSSHGQTGFIRLWK